MERLDLLQRRVAVLGNHYQKYLRIIELHKNLLIESLESSGKLMQVHLWQSSPSPLQEMKIVAGLSQDIKTRVQLISCYYVLQYLHMHFRNLDVLGLNLASNESQSQAYHNFMMRIGSDFRLLTKAYIENLLDIYLSKKNRPEFCICSVGTRADQDDIDIGIFTEEIPDLTEFTRAIRNINQNMLVFATPLHFYLSEHVGKEPYSSTIQEYDELLSKKIQDVVIISELLNARLITGSAKFFSKFKKRILSRYYYHPNENNLYHEGYLRGILGELRAMLLNQPQTDSVAPKYDSIRILKSFLYAKKAILNIKEVNAWEILDRLKHKEPNLKADYDLLNKAISFLELFKFMLQLFVIQEERFRIDELNKSQLTAIARRMGYKPIGMVSEWDQVLIDYYRYVREVRRICSVHLDNIAKHMTDISIFRQLKIQEKKADNIHFRLIHRAKFFEGAKFWEDLIQILEEDEELIEIFLKDFEKLSSHGQKIVIGSYINWAQYSIITLTRFITIFGRYQESVLGYTFFFKLNQAYLIYIEKMPKTIEWLCLIFSHYPNFIHQYFQILPISHFTIINRILDKPVIVDHLKEKHIHLRELAYLHQRSSRYFHRFFYRIIFNHPEYLQALTDPSETYKVSSGLLAMVDMTNEPRHRKEIIGNYYDFEFLRIGIGTLKGVDLFTTNMQFTEFCDKYLSKLFDICSDEIAAEHTAQMPNTDTIAILAAGGHARGQAYEDDYDLIALADTENEEVIKYATRIISRMNRNILERGLLPHYRMGEVLNGFVNSIAKVVEYLDSEDDNTFIDLSQLLGARMIIGSDKMKDVINKKILKPLIYHKKEFYIKRMVQEVQDRHKNDDGCGDRCNIKEAKGGIRDIEAVALMIKVYNGSHRSIDQRFFKHNIKKFPNLKNELLTLHDTAYFLRAVRNFYRITEAAEDDIQRDQLSNISELVYKNSIKRKLSKNLFKDINSSLQSSASAIDKIIRYLEKQVD
jgi:hypothetical protein